MAENASCSDWGTWGTGLGLERGHLSRALNARGLGLTGSGSPGVTSQLMRSGQARRPHTTLRCVSPTSSKRPLEAQAGRAGGSRCGLGRRLELQEGVGLDKGDPGSWLRLSSLRPPGSRGGPIPTFQERTSACSPRHIHPHAPTPAHFQNTQFSPLPTCSPPPHPPATHTP